MTRTLKTEILIAILGSGVLSTLISGLFTFLQSRRDAKNATALGVKSVLQDRIKWLGKQHIKRGCITFEDLEDLIKMHEVYHDKLKGNGYLDKVMTEVKALPVVERYEEYD